MGKLAALSKGYTVDTLGLIEGLGSLAYTLKILIYKENPNLIERLDINDDNIFLEPLLYTYFNTPPGSNRMPLSQLLYGYIDSENRPLETTVFFNGKGVAYLPNFGYIKLNGDEALMKATLWTKPDGVLDVRADGVSIPYTFTELFTVGGFELIEHISPMFYRYFDMAHVNGKSDIEEIDIESTMVRHIGTLERAIAIIKDNCPTFYQLARLANRKIMLFACPPINSFVTKDIQGAIFINVVENGTVSFFVDDLVHQWAHNILNAFAFDLDKFFAVNPEEEMLVVHSKKPGEKRNVYDAFHGLFTVAQRVECFRKLHRLPHLFTTEEYHELMARYSDQSRRYRTGLEEIAPGTVYTKTGWSFYKELDGSVTDGLNEISEFLSQADFSNQASRFSYHRFCEINGNKIHLSS